MRRLVGLSGRSSKAIMALSAVAITLSSIHLAAAVQTASLLRRRQSMVPGTQQFALALPGTPQMLSAAKSEPFQGDRTGRIGDGITPALGGAASPSTHNRRVVISIADRKLAVMEEGRLLKVYPIAVGTSRTPSPDGDFVIINRAKDPTYRHGEKEIPPGKDNPLGTRWMGLSLKGYGIHGTNVQSSVGKPT